MILIPVVGSSRVRQASTLNRSCCHDLPTWYSGVNRGAGGRQDGHLDTKHCIKLRSNLLAANILSIYNSALEINFCKFNSVNSRTNTASHALPPPKKKKRNRKLDSSDRLVIRGEDITWTMKTSDLHTELEKMKRKPGAN